MPYKQYICPDGVCFDIDQCLQKCRLADKLEAGRCLSKRTLMAVADQREWTGMPSTTQLLLGTREAYLRITKDYPVNPQDLIFALFGTGVHGVLEKYAPENSTSEERICDGTSSGAYDHYDEEDKILYDVKTYGSCKTMKTLGFEKVKTPVMGSDGKQRKHRNGRLMFDTSYEVGRKDRLDVAIQLNDYRMKIESTGREVNKMIVEIITRDAGTYSARDRGIFTNAQLVKINRISDHWIKLYMERKAELLLQALEKDELPPPCKHRETWGGLKCERFCSCWMHCDVGRKARGEDASCWFND